jgi:hypothetical protein
MMSVPGLPRAMTRRIVLLCVYVIVAGASFCGYFSKYAFHDDSPHAAMLLMLDGTADRPYVYRQLIPFTANLAEKAVPKAMKDRFINHLRDEFPKYDWITNTFARATGAANPAYTLRYYLAYGLVFVSLVCALLTLRLLCLALTGNEAAATLAPLAFAIAMPAGNFWDFPELFFMAAAVWIAVRGRLWWLIPLTLVATVNKESFLFFVVALYPFVRARTSRRGTLVCLAVCVAVAAAVNLLLKLHYAANPGDVAQFNLMTNLHFLVDPRHYLLGDYTYGMLLPKGFNVLILFILFVIARAGWPKLPRTAQIHALLVCVINIPLYLLFGWGDEVRALSMLHVTATLLIAGSIAGYLARAYRRSGASLAAGQ